MSLGFSAKTVSLKGSYLQSLVTVHSNIVPIVRLSVTRQEREANTNVLTTQLIKKRGQTAQSKSAPSYVSSSSSCACVCLRGLVAAGVHVPLAYPL